MLGINNENCFDTIRKMREKNRKGSEISTAQCNYARNRIEEGKNGSSSN